jgi:DNA polymerase III subunit delta
MSQQPTISRSPKPKTQFDSPTHFRYNQPHIKNPKTMPTTATTKAKNIYLFYGEDSFSCNQKLNYWKKEFVKKHDESGLESIDGNKIDPANFESNLESMPFLSEKKMIIVKNLLSQKSTEKNKTINKKIAKTIEKTPDFSLLIFHEIQTPDKRTSLYKKIAKIGKIEEFPLLSINALTKRILDQARERNLKIDFNNANYLATQCGLDLWTINNELDKLELFIPNQEITPQAIDEIVHPALSASIFRFTDGLGLKNYKEALKILKILVDSNEELSKIFFMIVRHFRILLQVKSMVDKNEPKHSITKKLKQHPFVIENMLKQSRNFSIEKLEKIYEELLQIDINVKTGITKVYGKNQKEFQLAIEKFIINCCS